MKRDITNLLKEWPYEPGKVNARLVAGNDGLPRVQVRLDLGLLQMFADGRPDGERPFGYESLLEYFEDKLDLNQPKAEDEAAGAGPAESAPAPAEALSLSPEDCRGIREEAAQYYQRYVACLVLEDFDRVIRDTTRNLRALDLCAKHAQTEQDRAMLEQFRPYITMMRARALASQAIRDNELKAAVLALDEALDALRRYFADQGRPQMFEQSNEVTMLRGMREALVPKLPISQEAELRQRLHRALETENYELAAILRDELKQIKKNEPRQ